MKGGVFIEFSRRGKAAGYGAGTCYIIYILAAPNVLPDVCVARTLLIKPVNTLGMPVCGLWL